MTKWTYLLVHDVTAATPAKMQQIIDSMPSVDHWFRCLPLSFLLVSSLTAEQLTAVIRKRTGNKGRFLIVDTSTDRNGWMPPEAWNIMQNPDEYAKKS